MRKPKKPSKPNRGSRSEIAHTVNEWCIMTGRDSRTLLSALRKVDVHPKPGERLEFKSIEAALYGEEYQQKVRNLTLDAQRKEREESEANGKLFPMAELEPWIVQNYIMPASSALASMPAALAARCNPNDPATARGVLDDWLENIFKPTLKTGLEKPRKEK